jgi:hypothetical protein
MQQAYDHKHSQKLAAVWKRPRTADHEYAENGP